MLEAVALGSRGLPVRRRTRFRSAPHRPPRSRASTPRSRRSRAPMERRLRLPTLPTSMAVGWPSWIRGAKSSTGLDNASGTVGCSLSWWPGALIPVNTWSVGSTAAQARGRGGVRV